MKLNPKTGIAVAAALLVTACAQQEPPTVIIDTSPVILGKDGLPIPSDRTVVPGDPGAGCASGETNVGGVCQPNNDDGNEEEGGGLD